MKLIDSHCHLDDFYKEGTLDRVLNSAKLAIVDKMIAIGTHREDWGLYSELAGKYENIFYTVGLHPLCISSADSPETEELWGFLDLPNVPVAIGEIGLDYHRLPSDEFLRLSAIENQKNVFLKQLKIAKESDLPVVIHSRDAFEDTLSALLFSEIRPEKTLFHCYDYGVSEMKKLMDLGIFVSFSGMLTFKKKLIEPLKAANLNRVLLETDCPFLTPEPHRTHRNEPAFMRATAEFASEILGISEHKFSSLTYENTQRFFSIN